MKSYQARGSRGFTLVELIVGVAVSGLVALFLFWMVAQDSRFKALERARAGVRDKVQVAIDLFQEDFRGIEGTAGLEARPGSFYVQSDKGLLTLDWGVRFKRWLYLSEGGRPGFQPLWVVWGAKKGSGTGSSWTLYRIVHREAYGQKIEVSRLELKPLARAELHLFGLNKRAEPGLDALVRLDKAYPYSVPSSELERLAYAELGIEALAQTGASQRMVGTFGQNYRPYRFVVRAQPRNVDAAFVNPKPLSGVSLPPPKAESDAMDRVDYIAEGVKTVTVEALQAGLQVIQLAVSVASMAGGAVSAPATAGAGAAAGGGAAVAAPALGSAVNLIMPIVETFFDKLLDWLIKPVLRATTTPGVVAYCKAALSNPISLGGSGAGGEEGSTQPQGGGVPKGIGLGVGGTPPGLGGTQPSVQALEEMNAASDALPSGNRSGLKGREAGPSRGDFLPGQSQGQGFAFGRAGKPQKTGDSLGQRKPKEEGEPGEGGAQQEPATEEAAGGSDEASGTWRATFTQAIETSPWKEAWLLPKGFFVARYEGYLFSAIEVNPAGLIQQATQAVGTQPQGGGVPEGVGLGVGGTPPGLGGESPHIQGSVPRGVGIGIGGMPAGHGGALPSLRALEELDAVNETQGPGNRSGLKGREAGPSRGDFLPGQSQGQGFAFGRAGKPQKTGGSQGQRNPGQEGEPGKGGAPKKQQETPGQDQGAVSIPSLAPSNAAEPTGIQFVPTAQNPYLALLGLPLNAGLDQNRKAALTFEGNTFASQDWGKVFVFAPYFMPGQSTPTHPLPINKGEPFDIQVLNSMENVTVGDLLAALFAALPFSRNAYVATLPFLKLLRTTAEGIDMLVQTLGQATSLLGGGQSGTGAAPPAPT